MSAASAQQILVIDSGVGGLTVLREIKKVAPALVCHYLADNVFFPYGTKSEKELQQRLYKMIQLVLERHALSAIVIACNSASTAVLDYLRESFNVPFVGVVPAIKPAASMSKNKTIGLLATEGTVRRNYTEQLIQQFASDCEIVKLGSQALVELAERKLNGGLVSDQELISIVNPLLETQVDVVVLGCTHFPWFKQELQRLSPSIQWLDSGDAIARRVKQIVSPDTQDVVGSTADGNFYFTGQPYTLDQSLLSNSGIRFINYIKF